MSFSSNKKDLTSVFFLLCNLYVKKSAVVRKAMQLKIAEHLGKYDLHDC